MKVLTLIENSAANDSLAAEHGLSLYIETDQHKILFDAGQTDAFAENAAALGVDFAGVDIAILSHGHYDHSGGLMKFMELNDHAPIYMSCHAFSKCYHGEDRYIGIDPALKDCGRLILTGDNCTIDEMLSLHSCNANPKQFPLDSAGLTVLENGEYRNDEFLHEQYLLIKEHEKTVLISGCSHKGILNITRWFDPDVLIGGFHFMNLDPQSADRHILDAAAKELMAHRTVYYTGHCTGQAQFDYLKAQMGDQLHALQGGCLYKI